MRVRELIAALKQYNPDSEVLTAADEEGNSFNTVYELDLAYVDNYELEHNSIESVHLAEDLVDDSDLDELDPEAVIDKTLVVVIWP